MIRFLLRVAIVGAAIGWILDRRLASRSAGSDPEPIRSVVVIDAPIQRVWQELADIEGQPRWMHDMKAVRVLTSGTVDVDLPHLAAALLRPILERVFQADLDRLRELVETGTAGV